MARLTFHGTFSIVSAFTLVLLALVIPVRAQPTIEFIDNGRGPVPLYLPSSYSASDPLPLIVALHGFTQDGSDVENYFDFTDQIEANHFAYLVPEGELDLLNQRFWNATDACCDIFGSGVDDSGYLRELVDSVRDEYAVDEQSIHFAGYSNGGFMAHRMAIDHADLVASIVSLAGANYFDAAAHSPSEPVHVLQVHGTADPVILYDGGDILGIPYPGAEQTVLNWVEYNGLQPVAESVGDPFNLDLSVPGPETASQVYDVNNGIGITVELWTMTDSDHGPVFDDGSSNLFASRTVPWLLSHRKSVVCDFNSDDACDIVDIDFLIMEIAAGTNDPSFDLNGDSLVDVADRDDWLADAGSLNLPSGNPYLVADLNLDGVVDGLDFIEWNGNKFSETGKWSLGDANADGFTDGLDFIEWNANKFMSSDGLNPVPEPSLGILLASALLGLALVRRR
jgi:polyhydroxybutyrate depolymerase